MLDQPDIHDGVVSDSLPARPEAVSVVRQTHGVAYDLIQHRIESDVHRSKHILSYATPVTVYDACATQIIEIDILYPGCILHGHDLSKEEACIKVRRFTELHNHCWPDHVQSKRR